MPARQPPRLVVETYEQKAPTWDADAVRPDMRFLGPDNVRDYLRATPLTGAGDLAVLDLGCGTGVCGEFLRPLAASLTGVDISAAMLQPARARQLYDQLVCDDLQHYLDGCRQRFDLVIASGVVIFFSDLSPLLRALAAVLKPGGRFLFTVYRADAAPIQVRRNYHFAHSADYLRAVAPQAQLALEELREIVHEYENAVAQPGYLVCLRRAAGNS